MQQLGAFPHKFYSADWSFESYLGFCDGSDSPWKISAIMNLQNFTNTSGNKVQDQWMRWGKRDGGKCSMTERGGHRGMTVRIVEMHGRWSKGSGKNWRWQSVRGVK